MFTGEYGFCLKEVADSCRQSFASFSLVEHWTCLMVVEQRMTVDSWTHPSKLNSHHKIRIVKWKPMPHRSIHFDSEAAEGVTAEQSTRCRVHSPARVSCSAALKVWHSWLCCLVRFRWIMLATFQACVKVVFHRNVMSLLSF